jgi:hypothetical protein
MSYEGYTQYLCAKGHYHTRDCMYDDLTICPDCMADIVWSNMVDVTNGSFEQDERPGFEWNEIRIDGYVELEVEYERKCDCCGSVLETTYKIPKKKRNKK